MGEESKKPSASRGRSGGDEEDEGEEDEAGADEEAEGGNECNDWSNEEEDVDENDAACLCRSLPFCIAAACPCSTMLPYVRGFGAASSNSCDDRDDTAAGMVDAPRPPNRFDLRCSQI